MVKAVSILVKIAMLLLATAMLPALLDVKEPAVETISPEMLPDYNYIPEVKKLIHLNRFREASELCRDIITQELPGEEEAKALKKLCDQEVSDAVNRLRRGAHGFVTGNSASMEEAGGAIISDMLIYGDIRDLAMQGWFKVTGQETDGFIVSLASIGLATEMIQWADWMPAVLKALRRTGAFTERFANSIRQMLFKAVKTGKADQASAEVFANLSKLLKRNSFQRSACILKHVETPKDLALYIKLAEKAPSAPYLILKSGGADGVTVIRKFADSPTGIAFLRQTARKGPPGIYFLKNYTPHKAIKWGAHISKAVYTGHFYDFVFHTAKTFQIAFWGFWAAVVMMYLYGATLFFDLRRAFRRLKKIRTNSP